MCVMDHLFPLYLLFRKSLGSTICGFEKCKYLWGIHGFLGFLQCHDGWGTSVLSLFFQQACHPGCQCIDGYLYYFKEDGSQSKRESIEKMALNITMSQNQVFSLTVATSKQVMTSGCTLNRTVHWLSDKFVLLSRLFSKQS